MKPSLPFAVALLLAAAPLAAEEATPASPAKPAQASSQAASPTKPAPAALDFQVPVKTQQLDAMDKLLERRMAEKRMPKSTSDIGLREVPKKKEKEAEQADGEADKAGQD